MIWPRLHGQLPLNAGGKKTPAYTDREKSFLIETLERSNGLPRNGLSVVA